MIAVCLSLLIGVGNWLIFRLSARPLAIRRANGLYILLTVTWNVGVVLVIFHGFMKSEGGVHIIFELMLILSILGTMVIAGVVVVATLVLEMIRNKRIDRRSVSIF